MRVIHCITGLTGDGAQRMLLRLVGHLQEHGVRNHVVSLSQREPLAQSFERIGVPVHSIGMSKSAIDVRALWRLRGIIDQINPELMQGWMYHANFVLSTLRSLLRTSCPIVWNIRRGMDDYAERKLSTRLVIQANKVLSSRAHAIIYCTPESREQHEMFGFDRGKGAVIGNGFESEMFAPNVEKRREVRQRFGVLDTDVLIGNIGRDDTAKGRPYLFEAFALLLKRFPHARLLLVGRGMSESNPELRRRLVAARIASRVILVGEYSPVSQLYPAMDILCSASVAEGFPNVVAEALCSGIPCVATDTGNTRTLLEGNGLVVPARSGPRLATALAQLCSESSHLRRVRGDRARTKIVSSYQLSHVTDAYLSLYRGLASAGDLLPPEDLRTGQISRDRPGLGEFKPWSASIGSQGELF